MRNIASNREQIKTTYQYSFNKKALFFNDKVFAELKLKRIHKSQGVYAIRIID